MINKKTKDIILQFGYCCHLQYNSKTTVDSGSFGDSDDTYTLYFCSKRPMTEDDLYYSAIKKGVTKWDLEEMFETGEDDSWTDEDIDNEMGDGIFRGLRAHK